MGGSGKGLLFRAGLGGGKGKRGGGVRAFVCPRFALSCHLDLQGLVRLLLLVQRQRLQHQQNGQYERGGNGAPGFEFVEDHPKHLHQNHHIASKIGLMSSPSRSLFA